MNLLLTEKADLADLSTMDALTVIFENVDWTWTQNDLTQGKFSALIGAFAWLDSSITEIKSDAYEYEKVRDYSYIGTDLFCENNGVNLGSDDYLETGICSCIKNASPVTDTVTQIEVCGCDDGFVMLTESIDSKSCSKSMS